MSSGFEKKPVSWRHWIPSAECSTPMQPDSRACGELRRSILFARNQHFCDDAVQLADGDEIAFLPPVSGGSDRAAQQIVDPGGHFFVLTRESHRHERAGLASTAGYRRGGRRL